MNAKFLFGSILLCLGVVIQGCNLKHESIRFAPQLEARQTDIGQGKVVGLEVADIRPNKQAGIVGDPKDKFINVTAEDGSPSAIYKEAADTLTKMGFKVEPATDTSERVLRLEVRELQYESLKRPFTFDSKASVLVGAVVKNGGDRYERTYQTEETSTTGGPPSQSEISKTVNRLLSASLNDVLADKQLMAILAK
jgi:uncharacterized lipoprotein YajG